LKLFYFRYFIHLFLHTCNLNGLKTVSNELEDKLEICLQLFCILYADDTVLMAE
jgi:hypothetical protein